MLTQIFNIFKNIKTLEFFVKADLNTSKYMKKVDLPELKTLYIVIGGELSYFIGLN
jgi:hypothetical protein